MNDPDIECLYEGKYLRLMNWRTWEYVERPNVSGIAVILAITDDNRLLLVEQFRPPLQAGVIELPAGLVGDEPGREAEPIESAATRELLEETGYECRSIRIITEGPPSPGCTSEMITFLQAEGLKKTGPGGGDASENITVHAIAVDDVDDWLEAQRKTGKLIDPKIYTALYLAGRK